METRDSTPVFALFDGAGKAKPAWEAEGDTVAGLLRRAARTFTPETLSEALSIWEGLVRRAKGENP
jgi:hypothetical protein